MIQPSASRPGFLDILNCGAGHLKITFDEGDETDVERAKRCLGDMFRRGYLVLIENPDGTTSRVHSFDPARNVYLVDFPDLAPIDATASATATVDGEPGVGEPPSPPKKRGRPKKEVPLQDAKVTAFAPTAGG